ncbi:hypothetical protein OJ996_14910 [Luteolibacter sp. GHJ8]|uniref:Uncharacterized protein n=1 Tax=Luteolibacter rhizosphaerae TaxID=2989719 RepID=A0ABT3G4V3_9BACT|nr:hypothetical protein [Luteolibacter rhizosphaerae]MCW1914876.1 hypothetical protein [Luteolibacter rhizosphaerae]
MVAPVDLDSDKQDLVDVVLIPLKEDQASRKVLEDTLRLASGMPTSVAPDAFPVVTDRMRSTALTSKFRALVPRLATLLVLTLSLGFLFSPATRQSLWRIRMATDSFDKFIPNEVEELLIGEPDDEDARSWIMSRIAHDQRLVAMGDLQGIDDARRWKAVWEAHEEDPAHFYAYVLAYRGSWYKWPENWVATGEKLDPDNGWFALIDACSRIGDVIEPATRKTKKGWGSRAVITPAKPARVKDEAELKVILAEIDHALALPAWTDFRSRLSALRMSAWSAPVDYPEQLLFSQFKRQHPEGRPFDSGCLDQLPLLFQGAALHFANTGNRRELDELARRYERIFQTFCKRDQSDLNQGVILWQAATLGAKAIEDAYGIMGDPAVAARFKSFAEAPRRAELKDASRIPRGSFTDQRASNLAEGWTIGRYPGVSALMESELRGGRLAEYAMGERVLMHVLSALLCCMLGLILFTAHYPRPGLRRLADRLLQLLAWRDWLWIVGLGMALPIALYLLLQRLPWPGFRNHTMERSQTFLMALQLTGLALSLLLCTVEVARWRLAKRAWGVGFGWRLIDAGPAFALFALGSMPVMSAVPTLAHIPRMDGDWIEAVIATVLGLPALWASMILVGCYLKKSPRRLHRLILLRACTPVMALALGLSVLSIFVIHAEEKKWTARIEFESVTNKDHYATGSRAGFEHARWIHSELKAIFGPGPD